MKMMFFASRNFKEILRDPLNIAFGLGFPVVLILLLSAIQANIPINLFRIDNLIPGIAVFGFSFISLFSGMLIAKDRSTSFLIRLYTTPMKAKDYILGYTLPIFPLALAQIIISYILAVILGLEISLNVFLSIVIQLPTAILFIGLGLLAGSIFNDKQVGAVCGALLTNLSAWLSGTWFDLNLVGGWFKKIAYCLPFAHGVEAGRSAITGNYDSIMPHLGWVIGYAAVIMAISILVFKRKMKSA